MIAEAAPLLSLLLAYLRVQGCVLTLPGFADRAFPARLRVVLALALTPLFAGAVAPEAGRGAALPVLAAQELAIGMVMGLFVRLLATSLAIAATAIAAAASLSQLFGADTEMTPHPIGNLLHLGGLAVLMAMGFPAFVADYIAAGFALWPAASLPDPGVLVEAAVAIVSRAFMLALVLASPFVLGGFLFQAVSGVVNRVMPAFPVVFAAAPAAILLALVALAVLSVPVLAVWSDAILDFALPEARP